MMHSFFAGVFCTIALLALLRDVVKAGVGGVKPPRLFAALYGFGVVLWLVIGIREEEYPLIFISLLQLVAPGVILLLRTRKRGEA
jgi:hypothetical protein